MHSCELKGGRERGGREGERGEREREREKGERGNYTFTFTVADFLVVFCCPFGDES